MPKEIDPNPETDKKKQNVFSKGDECHRIPVGWSIRVRKQHRLESYHPRLIPAYAALMVNEP